MTIWDPDLEHDDLHSDLIQLGCQVRFPPTPTFTMPAGTGAPRPHRLQVAPWPILALAAMLIALLTIPGVRHAAADLVNFPGIRIEFGDTTSDAPPTITSIGGTLLLGKASDLETTRTETGLPVLVPGGSRILHPPEVYQRSFQPGTVVSLLYPASDQLPEIGSTGVGLLLMAVDDGGSSYYLIAKSAIAESPPQPVTVRGADGLWIQGGVLTVEGGDPFWTYQRRSGNVLLWNDGNITYRMESALPLEDAIELVESLQPAGTSGT